MSDINKNSISLAGEFAVLSQLALRGYDANLTLGHTKNVDILVSHPETGKMYKLEVKTNYLSSRSAGSSSKLYRMGILTGRLRAYEREEDLIKLVK